MGSFSYQFKEVWEIICWIEEMAIEFDLTPKWERHLKLLD